MTKSQPQSQVWRAAQSEFRVFKDLEGGRKSPVVGYVSLIKEGTAGKMAALNWKPFVYGGLASITAECGTFPIDLTKTRLQIQGQTNDANFKEIRYRGMLHALVRIGREEGLKALYSGIAPAMLRQASYGTIKIGTYQSLKRLFVEHPEDETLLVNVVCGILSGVVSSTIANPTDVLKIRMQAQSSTIQGGMIGNFINIYQQEGARGLWKGVSLTAQRAAIVVGVELPVYDLTKKHLILSGLMGDTVYTHFLSSFTCGLAGALASNPVDVVRTRMMNQRVLRDGRCSGYTGTLDCLLQLPIACLGVGRFNTEPSSSPMQKPLKTKRGRGH
ncbi:kidney mitochondrial carrier protein 1 isoform X5 [Ursus arctos]|uniref:kidney mitochondrial carrier protein 1 isoform X5 n=2 Tax=Ursus arctos TaxID=9644 RepID=UPI001CF8D687|nr:kidney mitochondrial carrier protein 1 isoform X5 [Ursus arctos]